MARVLRQPKDPEAVGLAVLALRNYVDPVSRPNKFQKDTAATLTKLKVNKRTARRMVQNFDSIRPSVRQEYLGDLGTATSMRRRVVPQRDPNAVTTNHLVIPQMTLRYRYPGPLGPGQQLPPVPPVLAPIDYTIVYNGMHCIDETHWDWAGSDEIYIVTSAVHITRTGGNVVNTVRHPFQAGQSGTYGDVDSHETRVGPRAACWNGVVAQVQLGMSLTSVVFEHDYGDPDHFRDEVDASVKLAIAIATYLYPPAGAILALIEASGLITDFFNWLLGTGDDEIGTVTLVLDFDDLEHYSRSLLVTYSEHPGSSAPTALKYHFLASVNDNDYVSAYQVERNPYAPPYPQPPVE